MQAGSVGGGEDGGDNKYPGRDKLKLSVCDVSNDDFENTWLALKEAHDKEVQRLQAKLTSLRKEQLADRRRWMDSTAKITELTEQREALNATINELRDKLSSKVCDKCTVNETYKSTVQQEFYDIQEQNIKFIAELNAERNKLRAKNKILSAQLKLNPLQLCPPSDTDTDDDEDFIPCSQQPKPVFNLREPIQGKHIHLPVKMSEESNTEQMKSEGRKDQPESCKFSTPFYNEDLFVVPETSFETSSNDSNKHNTGGISDMKSFPQSPLLFSESSQSGHEFQMVSNLPEDKVDQPKMKEATIKMTSSQKDGTQKDFTWSLSTISMGEPSTSLMSGISGENMPDPKRSSVQRKETLPFNVFPLDYSLSGKRRTSIGIPRYNIGLRDGGSQTPFNEQLALRRNTHESTGAAEQAAEEPHNDSESSNEVCAIKRKAKTQSQRRRK